MRKKKVYCNLFERSLKVLKISVIGGDPFSQEKYSCGSLTPGVRERISDDT